MTEETLGGDLKDRLRLLTANSLGHDVEDITDNKPFAELGADSLDLLELICEIEDELGIHVPEDVDEAKLVDFAQLYRIVEKAAPKEKRADRDDVRRKEV